MKIGSRANRSSSCKIKICSENCTKNLGGQQSIENFHFVFTMLGVIIIRKFFLTEIVVAKLHHIHIIKVHLLTTFRPYIIE